MSYSTVNIIYNSHYFHEFGKISKDLKIIKPNTKIIPEDTRESKYIPFRRVDAIVLVLLSGRFSVDFEDVEENTTSFLHKVKDEIPIFIAYKPVHNPEYRFYPLDVEQFRAGKSVSGTPTMSHTYENYIKNLADCKDDGHNECDVSGMSVFDIPKIYTPSECINKKLLLIN